MKSIGHAIWHPFRHFRWLRWSLNNGLWLVMSLALLATICVTLSVLGHDMASTVVFDVFVVRGICFVVEALLDRVPDENFLVRGSTSSRPSIFHIDSHGVTPISINRDSDRKIFTS